MQGKVKDYIIQNGNLFYEGNVIEDVDIYTNSCYLDVDDVVKSSAYFYEVLEALRRDGVEVILVPEGKGLLSLDFNRYNNQDLFKIVEMAFFTGNKRELSIRELLNGGIFCDVLPRRVEKGEIK